jgi:hypothetical protein
VWRSLFFLLCFPQWAVATELQLSYAVESFYWEEFDANGNSLLDESGFRHLLVLSAEGAVNSRWLGDLRGRLLTGRVAYDGQDSLGNPVSTDTDYSGYGLEGGFSYLPAGTSPASGTGVRVALGAEAWERSLLGAGGYTERYSVAYGRVAGLFRAPPAWQAELGAKLPFATSESVNLSQYGFVEEIDLSPRGEPSLYATVRYRVNGRVGLQLGYDGYAFGKSDEDIVYNLDGNYYAVHQPKSDMHTLSVAVSVAL